jgi:electron transport complex protein RnfC
LQSTFKHGVHPAANKGLSDKKNIVFMPPPSVVYISTAQHIGKAAKPLVAKGDRVIEGRKIGEADGFVSAPVFSSVTGTVREIKTLNTPLSRAEHIVIERDETSEETFRFKPLAEKERTGENILQRIQECGIVGMGGAGFPTHVKLRPKDKVDTFIINAAECEPYITCDYRILLEYTEPFLRGALYMAKAVGLNKVYIGIEDNKADAANFVAGVAAEKKYDVEVVTLKSKYPQGAEKQLIYAMTGRKVPTGALPSKVGVVVDNVHTALSVCLAVEDGQPLYKRIMTVSGDAVNEPKNFWAAGGSLYSDIIAFCGGVKDGENAPVKLISGGPMMGIAVSDDEIASTKTTSCLLLLSEKEAFTGQPQPCINCGKCAAACPMRLMPMYIDSYILNGDVGGAVKYGAKNCIECGCCAFACPAKRPLVQSIRLAKKKARENNL